MAFVPLRAQAEDRGSWKERAEIAFAARNVGADVAIHLFADAAMMALTAGPPLPCPVVPLLFRPRAHYPDAFGSRLTTSERRKARLYETTLALWRRRPDARAVLTFDEVAARRWAARSGAPAYWLPEAPVPDVVPSGEPVTADCVVFGRLAQRKGLDQLAAAVALEPTDLRVRLVGEVDPRYRRSLELGVERMQGAGAQVVLEDERVTEEQGLRALRSSRCVVAAYPRHFGSSRVVLEAAAVGTPVIAEDFGLMGHQVRTYRLGVAIRCGDPGALRNAIYSVCRGDPEHSARAGDLRSFAQRYDWESFARAVRAAAIGHM